MSFLDAPVPGDRRRRGADPDEAVGVCGSASRFTGKHKYAVPGRTGPRGCRGRQGGGARSPGFKEGDKVTIQPQVCGSCTVPRTLQRVQEPQGLRRAYRRHVLEYFPVPASKVLRLPGKHGFDEVLW